MDDSNDTGLLTEQQRDFLRGPDPDMSDRGRRAAKSRIRNRFAAAFDDLRLLLGIEEAEQQVGLEEVLADMDAGRVWPLAALLFMWSADHPMYTDRDDFVEDLSAPDVAPSPQARMDRITASFDSQVEAGVRAALEFGDLDHVPEKVTNDLTVSLGEPVSDQTDEELAELPRRTLDILFRRGDLDNSEYARVMELKLKYSGGGE